MSDDIKKTIPAGQSLQVARQANTFFMADATDEVAVELYRAGQRFLHAQYVKSNYKYLPPGGMDMAIITNNTAAPVDVLFYMLPGDVDVQVTKTFDTKVKNTVAEPVPVTIQTPVTLTATDVGVLSPSTLATVADTAVNAAATLQVVAAAAVGVKQREATIKNLAVNVAGIRVGDANTGAARGHELMPGESYTVDTLDAIYVYNAGAAAQSVSIVTNSRA